MAERTTCRGGCARVTQDPVAAGWSYLEISCGYRCGECGRVLRLASVTPGPDVESVDTLSPTDRGGLPSKHTVTETVLPPSVKP